jgi:DNA-3-methyladenine glycosylase II/AraC family transcriptional regulator of adaptative response / DNA-3-methyladenine glycosylase II
VVRLPFEPPYDVGAVLANLAAHAVPGLELCDRASQTFTRVIAAPSGPALVTVTFEEGGVAVEVAPDRDAEFIAALVRRWLDLDAEPGAVVAALGDDPTVGPLVAQRPGLRVIGYLDGFEAAALTVLGQQVSLRAAGTFGGRLVAAYGTSVSGGLSAFPEPHAVAASSSEELQRCIGLTHARARTLHALAEACADGLHIHPDADHAEVRARLLALPGIGPWTADYLTVRALGDRDAFVSGDLVLRRALGVKTARVAEGMSQAWRPWRAYALVHLWTHAAYAHLA